MSRSVRQDYDTPRSREACQVAPQTDLPNDYPQHMPRGSWLWPDDRTGPEWYDKHDERL